MPTPTDHFDPAAQDGLRPGTTNPASFELIAAAAGLPEACPILKTQTSASPPTSFSPTGATFMPWRIQGLGTLLENSSSWLTSMIVHMSALLILALWYLPELPALTTGLLQSLPSDTDQVDDIAELEPLKLDLTKFEDLPEAVEVQPETNVVADSVNFSDAQDAAAPPALTELADFGLDSAPDMLADRLGPIGTTGMDGRGQLSRTALVRRGGGSEATERAVAMALKWLADHQSSDGTWSLDHTGGKCQGRCDHPGNIRDGLSAGTALGLLPFLGAGQTHQEGRYKQVVERGLTALIRLGKPSKDGISWRDGGTMYSHGLAAIALCEAYGMTGDERLYLPAQGALSYIVYAQDPSGGGWRYAPRAPGDTSVVGWQVMALKSGHLARLSVPPETVAKASMFLDGAQTDNGARYFYGRFPGDNPDSSHIKPTDTLSAVGLLARMYMGWKRDHPALQDGVARLAESGPSRENYYYNYYGAQVLFQHTGGVGNVWRAWNEKLRDQLIEQQEKKGHAKGSWYVDGPHNDRGGRIFTTSLATMSLEVYYRYMPIYQAEAVEEEFPE